MPEDDDPVSGALRGDAPSVLRDIAASDPHRAAVVMGDRSLSYAVLDRQVDVLARVLLDAVPADGEVRVALRILDGIGLAVSSLAVARAGLISVPIDPTAPLDRVQAMLEAADARIVVSDVLGDDVALRAVNVEVLPLDVFDHDDGPVERIERKPRAEELSSIVFTSGSTGVPKGILLPQTSRSSFAQVLAILPPLPRAVRWGLLSAGSVGLSELGFHGAVQIGATLHLYDARRLGLAPYFDWIRDERIQLCTTVPTVLRLATAAVPDPAFAPDLELVVFGSEPATWEDVALLRTCASPEVQVINIYGLSECSTVAAGVVRVGDEIGSGPLPVGHPVEGVRITVEDPDGVAVAPGAVGEIVVDSEMTALGYLGDAAATASRFVSVGEGRRRFRTGDVGRVVDGQLQHLGRIDHQVQISGVRVELGEVEVTLRRLPHVAAAAAASYVDARGHTRIVAFAVPAHGEMLHAEVLRRALARTLSRHAVPDRVLVVAEIPQLAAGKVDRRAFVELAQKADAAAPATTRAATPREAVLQALFADVLDRDAVGLDDDFFALGGDSLRAASLVAGLGERLGIEAPLAVLLEAPTPSTLAAALELGRDSRVVVVRAGGDDTPLFLVHDGGGGIIWAAPLAAEVGGERPVYAIAPDPLEAVQATPSFEHLARSYVEDLRRVQPTGPYLLFGSSLGGLIAFAMTRELERAGESVALLCLGDAPAPGALMPETFSERARRRATEMRGLPAPELARAVLGYAERQARHRAILAREWWTARRGVPDATPKAQVPEGIWQLGDDALRAFGMLAIRYRPDAAVAAPTVLIRAGGVHQQDDLGWRRWAQRLEVRAVPGDHWTYLHDTNLLDVARELRAALKHHAGD